MDPAPQRRTKRPFPHTGREGIHSNGITKRKITGTLLPGKTHQIEFPRPERHLSEIGIVPQLLQRHPTESLRLRRMAAHRTGIARILEREPQVVMDMCVLPLGRIGRNGMTVEPYRDRPGGRPRKSGTGIPEPGSPPPGTQRRGDSALRSASPNPVSSRISRRTASASERSDGSRWPPG